MRNIIFYFLLFPIIVSAQLNESDSLKVKASLSLTGFYQGGNVETVIFRTKTDFSVKLWKNWVFKNQNSYIYQEFGKVKADEDILSLNFLYLNPDRKIYPFVLGFISTNYRRDIDLRYLVGAGATFQIFNKDNNWLKVSLSSEYENTDFKSFNFNFPEYDGVQSINTIRGTIWVNGKYQLFKNKLILTHESYYQPSLEDSNNYRWQADVALELPIWEFLNFKINYRHFHERIVIESQEKEDRFLTLGFTLKSF